MSDRWCRGAARGPVFEPAIADGGEAVAGQAAFRGARRLIECGGDLGYENLPVGRQIEALVGLVAGLLPVPVVVEQIPEGDVVAALRQEQAAGAQGVADRERERGLPDGAVELAVGDQIGSPVTLHEAVRVIRRQWAAAAGIARAQDLDRPDQGLAAGGGL